MRQGNPELYDEESLQYKTVLTQRFDEKSQLTMKNRINILLVSKPHQRVKKRSIKQIWKLSRSLVKLGIDVTILYSGKMVNCENSHIKDGVIITEIPYFGGSLMKPLTNLIEIFFFKLAVKKWIKKNKQEFDMVYHFIQS